MKKANPKQNGVLTLVGRVNDFKPFISQGLTLLVSDEDKAKPVNILRDTGESQSLMLKGVLLLSTQSYTGSNVLIQGVKSEVISIPLHIVSLSSGLGTSMHRELQSLELGSMISFCYICPLSHSGGVVV